MSKVITAPNRRPARIQVNPEEFEEELPPQSGTVFNIWYHKWSGGANSHTLVQSKYKLDVERDSGYTKGDKHGKGYFCLFFAKGMCCKGKSCEYLHRIPDDVDVFPLTVDCFGREKFSDYRDDMSGVGSFNTVNKTLYIGGVLNKDGVQDAINREFRKLGKISKINVIAGKNCAFVTYKNESNAQFAKEVMHGQSLYGTDILNVKWAHEDPNPEAVRQKKRQLEEETQQVVMSLLEKFDSKRTKFDEEPIVDEPEEMIPQKIEEPIKQIEAPKTGILSDTALEGLRLLKKAVKQPEPLVGSYESSDDE